MSLRNILYFLLLLTFSTACRSHHEDILEKADAEALHQKSQLAKYLYLQVIENRKSKDVIRYRALKGLAAVSMSQLSDYNTAVKAMGLIFEEFDQNSQFAPDVMNMRLMAARIWRLNLDQPEKALDVLSPVLSKKDLTKEFTHELGKIYTALGEYDQAETWLKKTWSMLDSGSKDCEMRSRLQLDLIQIFSIRDQCGEAMQWANVQFPKDCSPDSFSVTLERAHCLEITGEITKAVALYEELLKKNPKNTRALFFLDNLKERQKEKQRR